MSRASAALGRRAEDLGTRKETLDERMFPNNVSIHFFLIGYVRHCSQVVFPTSCLDKGALQNPKRASTVCEIS